MLRLFKHPVTSGLLALAVLSLLTGWLTGYWTLGAAAAVTSLCLVPIGLNVQFRTLVQRLSGQMSFFRTTVHPVGDAAEQAVPVEKRTTHRTDASLVEQMIDTGRVALLLRPQIAGSLSSLELQTAQQALDDAMAIVPEGQVAMRPRCYDAFNAEVASHCERLVHVDGLFLDRYAVTNEQYSAFVSSGGYEQMSLWDESIWPAVLTFVDRTGQPGPRFWSDGTFLMGLENHPIVGISWYEACAYARWVGKRLPTDAEWVKAASWPVLVDRDKPLQRRFPWGDSMDRRLANIWGSGHDATIPVHSLQSGASASGALQLVGNVWEWTTTPFGAWEPAARKIETDTPLKSIRGGAFDTYFETQVHSQFQSGAHPLDRKHNIGFRCALGFCDVVGSVAENPDQSHETPSTQLEEALA